MFRFKLCVGLLALALFLSGCSTGPETLLRSHAYQGPVKQPSELATIFVPHPGIQTYHTLICGVDGKSYARMGMISSCPSVVFVTPGAHTLTLETRYANLYGKHAYALTVEAGRTYEVITTPTIGNMVEFNVRRKAPGHVLTYREMAPVFYVKEGREDAVVPMTSN